MDTIKNYAKKAGDWLDEAIMSVPVPGFIKEAPLVKAAGEVLAHPDKQTIGEQAYKVAGAASQTIGEAFKDPMAIAGAVPAIGALTAYHGTPHKIVGGFKKEAIGTGEGAQAFGHGFYATDAPEIAHEYMINLSNKHGTYNPKIGNLSINDYYSNLEKQSLKLHPSKAGHIYAKMDLIERLGMNEMPKDILKYAKENYPDNPEVVEWFNKEVVPNYTTGGAVYTLDIPEPDVMLDWDKPLSQQTEEVKKILTPYIDNMYGPINEEMGGGQAVKSGLKNLEEVRSIAEKYKGKYAKPGEKELDRAVSEFLYSKGIKGIRYKAGQISGANTNASNYVIFEPEDIKITAEEFLDK